MRSRAERALARGARNAALDAADKAAAETLSQVSLEASYPLFTESAVDGKCPRCKGGQFRRPASDGIGAVLALGPVLAAVQARNLIDCVTCGMRFGKG